VANKAIWTVLILVGCGGMESTTPAQRLTVSVTGGGAVISTPAGIDCGSTCTSEFEAGTTVTLTAAPGARDLFASWSGDCLGTRSCTVTMDRARAVTANFAARVSPRWVAHVGFPGADLLGKVVVDHDGNVIAGGWVIVDPVDDSNPDLFIIKYAKEDGHVLWTQHLATVVPEFLNGLATDAAGDVYVAGSMVRSTAPVTYGKDTLTPDEPGNIVVLRLSGATGDVVWARQWGGAGADWANTLAVSGTDLYVVGGTSSNPSTFGDRSIAAPPGSGYVVRASTLDGAVAEVKLIPGPVYLSDVAVNGADIAVVGTVDAPLALDGPCRVSPVGKGSDALILDLAGATLACRWARSAGDPGDNKFAALYAVAAYPGGGWVTGGAFSGSLALGGVGTALAAHGGDALVGRFAADGEHLWSFRHGEDSSHIMGVGVTADGAVIIGGNFDAQISFGPITLTGKRDAFVARLSPGDRPTYDWAIGLGGADVDLGNGLAVGPDGAVYLVSGFDDTTELGATVLFAENWDGWIVALDRP
jgi:hypothetical protein